MSLLFLFLFFFLPKSCSGLDTHIATPSATLFPLFEIISAPDSPTTIGQEFSVKFKLSDIGIGQTFYFKPYDKQNPSQNYIQYKCFDSDGWCHYTSSFNDLPFFISDQNGQIENFFIIRFNADKNLSNGQQCQIAAKTKQTSTQDWLHSTNIKIALVSVPTPTLTPQPTAIPTSTPKPSSTPRPTAIPTKYTTSTPKPTSSITPTFTPTPSKLTPSPTKTGTPSATPTDQSKSQVLGTTTTEPPSPPKDPRRILPIVFMVAGGLFLTTPALITKFKKIKKK